jgi:Sec-independent protein translocase protein TatA
VWLREPLIPPPEPLRLPELGRGLGESIRGFKDALEEHHDDDKDLTKPK